MEQLLTLDFVSHEQLIRGIVMFAALGLVVVQRAVHDIIPEEPEGDTGGVVLDPFAGDPAMHAPRPLRSAGCSAPRSSGGFGRPVTRGRTAPGHVFLTRCAARRCRPCGVG